MVFRVGRLDHKFLTISCTSKADVHRLFPHSSSLYKPRFLYLLTLGGIGFEELDICDSVFY